MAPSQPASANTLDALADVQAEQGHRDAARRTAAVLRERFPKATLTPFPLVGDLYDRNQVDSLALVLSRIEESGAPGQVIRAKDWLANLAILRGRLGEWSGLQRAVDQAVGAQSDAASILEDSLYSWWFDILLRRAPARAVTRMDAEVSRASLRGEGSSAYYATAWTYAMAGRPDRARAILGWFRAQTSDSLKRDRSEQLRHLALGEIALAEHRAAGVSRTSRLKAARRNFDEKSGGC